MAIAPAPEREAELRAMGLPQEAIAAYLRKEAIERGDLSDAIEVFADNWDAVRVYQLCMWDIQPFFTMTMGGGASGFRHMGIRCAEVESACRAHGVRFDAGLMHKVHILVSEAKRILNEE